MIKIVSFKLCPFVQRVTAMLEAKEMAYEISYIDLTNKPQWFLDISPASQVPVLITPTGTPLFESDAIVEYIDEITPPLQTDLSPEQRALNRAWSYQASKHYLVQCSTMQSPGKTALDERMAKLTKSFDRTEKQFGDGPYFAGTTLGNVDMAWMPLLHRAAIVEDRSGYDMLQGYPKLKAWQKSLMATGIPEKSVPEDFEEKFSGFYLAERTWLGRGADPGETDDATAIAISGRSCC